MVGDVASPTAEVTYASAAWSVLGSGTGKGRDGAADAGAGRLLEKFSEPVRTGELLPQPAAELTADSRNEDGVAALRDVLAEAAVDAAASGELVIAVQVVSGGTVTRGRHGEPEGGLR